MSLLLASLLSVELIYAEAPASYAFSHIDIESGLSNSFSLWAAEDCHGAVWFSTEAGITRVTGDGCTVLTTSNSSLLENGAEHIFYNKVDDQIWVFTSGSGLSIIDCKTLEASQHPEASQFHSKYMVYAADATDGGIWMGFADGAIQHRDTNGNYTLYSSENVDGLPNLRIRFILDDGHNHLYLGYDNRGMSLLDIGKRTIKYFKHDDSDSQSLPGNNTRIITLDQYQNVWVGTNHGLALFDPIKGTFLRCSRDNGFPMDTNGDNVMGLCMTREGSLWMASEPGGITILDLSDFASQQPQKVKMKYLTSTNSQLSSPHSRSVLQDQFGNIWIGHYGTGIDVVMSKPSPFHILSDSHASNDFEEPKHPLRFAYGISLDSKQNLWIGGSSMLYRYRNNKFEQEWDLSPYLGRPYGKAYITFCDSHDRVWIGIDDVGVVMFDPSEQKFQKIRLADDFLDVHAFMEDRDGNIWIGTERGIYLFDGKEALQQEWMSQNYRNNVIFALKQDKLGRIWVGTFGSGIMIYDIECNKCDSIDSHSGLCNDNITQIYEDADGSFWITTRGGLAYINDPAHPQDIQNFGKAEGILDDHIRAVCQDQLGQIWVSTNTSISCWDARNKHFSNFDYHNGIPYGGFVESSACTSRDGNLYFASPNGICYFNPRLIIDKQDVTPVQITRIEQNDNYHIFSFSVANYAQRNLVEYAYRMEGLDDNWHNTLGDTKVTFRNLHSGHYTFQVMARLRNGDWDDSSLAETKFYIAPPLYLRWWAILGYTLIFLAILSIIFHYYLHKVKLETYLKAEEKQRQDERHLNDERLRFYTNITHELRTPLTLILGPLEDLVGDDKLPNVYHHRLKAIHASALRLLNLINQILEFRKTETQNRRLTVAKGDLRKVVREVGLRYYELNRNKQVKVCVQIPENFPIIYFDAEVVSTILNNLLSNAMKYTAKGSVTLSLEKVWHEEMEFAEMKVADTGYGIPEEALPHIFDRYYQADGKHQASGSGIGLAIVKSLAKLHEGEISVVSEIDKGSCFTFSIPIDSSYPNALHKDETESEQSKVSPPSDYPHEDEEQSIDQRPILLVVEDNDDIRQYILESFDIDYQVITASNGKEGLDAALKHIPNIIVSDIMMPIMDGIEFCKAVKGDIRTSHIPVILLTAKDTLEDKEQGYDSGADSYLTKPFSAKLLQSRIQNLLSSRRHLADLIKSSIDMQSAEKTKEPDTTTSSPVLNPLDQQFIEKLNGIINENLSSESLDISLLTERMYMSNSTLYRKVKGLIGMSPNEYIRHLRLQAACQMLQEHKHNISEIAYLTGFGSPNYFRDCFKAEYGMSPTEFIKKNEK